MHNFNRDLPEESVRKQLCWRQMETHGHILLHYLIVVFHTVGIWLPEWGETLHFHFSLTTFLQGKQKLTNQKFAHVNPRKRVKKKVLLHKHAYPYNNSCSTKNPVQKKSNKISPSIQLSVSSSAVKFLRIIQLVVSYLEDARFSTPI